MLEREGVAAGDPAGESPPVPPPDQAGRVTVAGKPSTDIPPGTLANIFRQAGIARGERDQ